MSEWTYEGKVVDVVGDTVTPARVMVRDGVIAAIEPIEERPGMTTLVPGFVDAHVHIESSMLAPTAFARAAVLGGVVGSVSDPHEIANVLGREGVLWMVENGARSPFKFYFGAPSCVPATTFESAGAHFDAQTVASLLDEEGIHYLAEVMNFPAVIGGDPSMLAIVEAARSRGMRIDGHAPGVMGEALDQYLAAGIETDHECFTLEQAKARLERGMRVAIREGSAARNFDALWPSLLEYPERCFFCSDDKHPDDLVRGYLNEILRRAVAQGVKVMEALRAATLNPVRHYGLSVGLLQVGDPADMVELDGLEHFNVLRTWIDGQCVGEAGKSALPEVEVEAINRFQAKPIEATALRLEAEPGKPYPVIVAEDGQLITGREDRVPRMQGSEVLTDPEVDVLKIVVLNRYENAPPAVALIRNFGLKTSAIAGSVAHDSHNVVAVGANDAALVSAINAVVACGGGLSYADACRVETLPLPIAGLMSEHDPWSVAEAFERLTAYAQADGCSMRSPYMTLSFMALLVIPSLKLSDKGLFDGERFTWAR